MGQGCPREKGTQEPIGKKAHGRVTIRERIHSKPKKARQDQAIIVGMTGEYGRT